DLKLIEADLGFEISVEAAFTDWFSGTDLAMIAPAAPGQEPTFLWLTGVKNGEKVEKVLRQIEKEIAEDHATSDTAAAASPIKEEKYRDVVIKSMPSADGTAYYSLFAKRLAVSNSLLALQSVIDRVKEPGKGSTLADNPKFVAATKGLKMQKPHVLVYMDYSSILDALPQAAMSLQLRKDMGQDLTFAMGFALESTRARFEGFCPVDMASDSIIARNIKKFPPGKISIGSYVPSTTLLYSSANTFDGEVIYDQFREMMASMAPYSAMGMSQPGTDPNAAFDAKIKELEANLGFRVKEDLLMQIGPEVGVGLNDIRALPMSAPVVNLTVAVQAKDADKIKQTMEKLVAYIEKEMAASMPPPGSMGPGQAPPPAPKFESVDYAGTTLRYLTLPMMPYSPGYAIKDKTLLITLTVDGLKNALDCHAGSVATVTSAAGYVEAMKVVGEGPVNGESYVDCAGLVEVVKTFVGPFLQMNPNPQSEFGLAFMESLKRIKILAGVTRTGPQGIRYEGLMTME
ncbi:MAG: DUF3352 domain-containing protein, partial [bacterium]